MVLRLFSMALIQGCVLTSKFMRPTLKKRKPTHLSGFFMSGHSLECLLAKWGSLAVFLTIYSWVKNFCVFKVALLAQYFIGGLWHGIATCQKSG